MYGFETITSQYCHFVCDLYTANKQTNKQNYLKANRANSVTYTNDVNISIHAPDIVVAKSVHNLHQFSSFHQCVKILIKQHNLCTSKTTFRLRIEICFFFWFFIF